MASPDRYQSIHHIQTVEHATERDLRNLIRTFPVIDNHAHNILREENAQGGADYPFECITSEAQGHALLDHVHTSLPHIRGIKQLAELYQCRETLEDVKAARHEWIHRDYPSLVKKCFEGTHALLIDDGLQQDLVYPVKWHQQFVPTASRIVRIESIASEQLEQLAQAVGFLKPGVDADWSVDQSEAFLSRWNTMFRAQIRTLAAEPVVRGFKSVVCYRSGLDIGLESRNIFRPHQSLSGSNLLTAFHDFLKRAVRHHDYRIAQKDVNDFLVVAACDVLEKLLDTEAESLPIQFHTGLGDTDIDLVKSNPAYMQPLIEAFPNVDFVILHSSYPYTREAGYLAANYANAWLDIGEVFPMLSRAGEETVLRQALELAPASKILWSTDGHFFPETFYLANRQFRETLETVLMDLVRANDLNVTQATDMAVNIMFWNSNTLYKLDEERRFPHLKQACGRSSIDSARTLVARSELHSVSSHISELDGSAAATTTAAAAVATGTTPPSATPSAPVSPIATRSNHTAVSGMTVRSPMRSDSIRSPLRSDSLRSPARSDRGSQEHPTEENVRLFETFMQSHAHVKYIWIQFLDYTGTLRNRMIPIAQFRKQLSTGRNPGITCALTRLMQNDFGAEGCNATGEFKLAPDMSTICVNKAIESPSATVQTWWMLENELNIAIHWEACPRWTLKRHLTALKREFNITMLMGFEIEIIFMRPVLNADKSDFSEFTTLHHVHSWSNMTYHQLDVLPIVEEIVETFSELGIELGQFHAESAPGQWEFPLPAMEPLKSIDMLYKARDVIRNVARKYGLKATLYPRPFTTAPGSASHTHFSINGPINTVERYANPFLAGILLHLPSILAFTLPLEESYSRVCAGIWAGGEYIAWGTQNREVPLRRCGPGHWELKTVDGIGNMYLSMAALVAAGLHGLRENFPLQHRDTPADPSTLSDHERSELGISTKLPSSLRKALAALSTDEIMRKMMGQRLVEDYMAVKEAEMKMLSGFEDDKRRLWLMARY